jgi:hypothetical protein
MDLRNISHWAVAMINASPLAKPRISATVVRISGHNPIFVPRVRIHE